jgi:ABC-2 type transport system ATP-binding protein
VKYVSGFGLTALSSHPPTLEELMLRHYGDDLVTVGESNRNEGIR